MSRCSFGRQYQVKVNLRKALAGNSMACLQLKVSSMPRSLLSAAIDPIMLPVAPPRTPVSYINAIHVVWRSLGANSVIHTGLYVQMKA